MADKSQDFCHLHQHTDYSLLDGCCRTDRLMARAAELGMSSIAITDHGNLFGVPAFFKAAKKHDIKPIIGCEVYLVHDHNMHEKPRRDKRRSDDINDVPEDQLGPEDFPRNQIHHKGILAATFEGYQNLAKLVSKAHVEGMYYRPRIDVEAIAAHAKGLIGLSGCVNGVAAQYLIYNDYENAHKATAQFVDIFGKENYFIEIQDHGLNIQRRIIPGLLKLAKAFDLKVICSNDVHYVLKEDWQPHDALLCIQTGKRVSDVARMKYPSREFYLKSRAEMAGIFKEVPEALDNTLHVAEMCNVKLPFGENHYPVFDIPADKEDKQDKDNFNRVLSIYVEKKNEVLSRDGKDLIELTAEDRAAHMENGTYLFELCKQGLKERYEVDYDSVRAAITAHESGGTPLPETIGDKPWDEAQMLCDKLDYELAIIAGTGFTDYFLIVWDFIDWARKQDIPVGPGRGSGAGCMVAYVLKITDIEPIRFGLLFERMLNLERVSPPDFDVDFCMRRRDKVVEYVRDKYGADHVANIITYGTFGAKMVVRDIARVLDLPYAEADRIAKMVPDDLNISLADSLKKSAELAAEVRTNPVAKAIMEHGQVIEGMVRNTGKHACGIIIGDQPLTNLVPLTLQEGDLTTQYAKGPVEDMGMLKMDFLGLKTLTIISDAQDNVRRTRNLPDFDIEKVTLEDSATFDLLNIGQTVGVFQLESGGMQSLCRRLRVSSFEEIIALIALYRPGPMQFIDQFIEGKRDPATVKVPHPLIKDLVEETYGILVYQEQVMQTAQIIAGYTLGNADLLRRAMGKKIKEVMDQQKQVFIDGAKTTNNIDKKTAEEIFAILEKFAQYGFNKSHSAAYAMLSYRTAYLKANYPVEFMAAVLSAELGNADKVSNFIAECAAMKIPVLGPDVNESRSDFAPVLENDTDTHGRVRFGLGAIKGVGDIPATAIVNEREAKGPFKDFVDFCHRVDMSSLNRRVLECLIKTGAFDSMGHDRQHLLNSLDGILADVSTEQADRARGQASLFDMLGEDDAAPLNEHRAGVLTEGDTMPELQRLTLEKELLGFYLSGHPLDKFQGLDTALNSFTAERFLELPDREPVRLCGIITGFQKRISKKNNRQWALFKLATQNGSYEVTLFPDSYDKFKDLNQFGRPLPTQPRPSESPADTSHAREPQSNGFFDTGSGESFEAQADTAPTAVLDEAQQQWETFDEAEYVPLLSENALIILHGTLRANEGERSINTNEVFPLHGRLFRFIEGLDVLLDVGEHTNDFLLSFADHLHSNEGNLRVRLFLKQPDGTAQQTGIANSLSVQFTHEQLNSFRAHPAVLGVRLHTTEVPDPKPAWAQRG